MGLSLYFSMLSYRKWWMKQTKQNFVRSCSHLVHLEQLTGNIRKTLQVFVRIPHLIATRKDYRCGSADYIIILCIDGISNKRAISHSSGSVFGEWERRRRVHCAVQVFIEFNSDESKTELAISANSHDVLSSTIGIPIRLPVQHIHTFVKRENSNRSRAENPTKNH